MKYIEYVTGQEVLELSKIEERLDMSIDAQHLYWTSNHPLHLGKLWQTINLETLTQYWRYGETIIKVNVIVCVNHSREVLDEMYEAFGI